ncbi:MAG: segregation/condensation protein A, partial [Nanoarchaeota archaeon]
MKGEDSEAIAAEKEFTIESNGVAITNEKITEHHLYDVIVSRKPEWQAIIYELINSQQLDPWDIDLVVLTQKYFEKIFELEEHPDFYISSKVLLAAALLLRIKSEILLHHYIRSVDEILFGKKTEKKVVIERITIDEGDLPLLIPRTPMARLRKITLSELMEALNKAISTETRRIKREIAIKRAHRLSYIDIPQFRRIDIKDRIKAFYIRILKVVGPAAMNQVVNQDQKVSYSSLTGLEKEQKIACFLPLLHLSNTRKLWLEQEKHLDEIWIYLYSHFE